MTDKPLLVRLDSDNIILKPEVIVFAGPNVSGKSTITRMAKTVGRYINADEIKRATLCTDLEAAQKEEQLRDIGQLKPLNN